MLGRGCSRIGRGTARGLRRRRLRSGSLVGPLCLSVHYATKTFDGGGGRDGEYKSGWMGLRSVPITLAEGNWCANSIAHIPVPVAMSRTL